MKIKGIKKDRRKTIIERLGQIVSKRSWGLALGSMALLGGSKAFLPAFTYASVSVSALENKDNFNACTNVDFNFDANFGAGSDACSDVGFDACFEVSSNISSDISSDVCFPGNNNFVPDYAEDNIRVLICNSDYRGIFHNELTFKCNADLKVTFLGEGEKEEAWKWITAGDTFKIRSDDSIWEGVGDGKFCRIRLQAVKEEKACDTSIEVVTLKRSQSSMSYEGMLEIYAGEAGMVLVNELPLEEYLYGVVPGEMPASYPLEALKAQAVCARTYAVSKMQQVAYPEYGAHLDDSTAFQVYNTQEKHTESNLAVDETRGQLLVDEKGEIVEVYYYSTSCGMVSDEVLFETFIKQSYEEDYECEEPWYRWSVDADGIKGSNLLKRMKECYDKDRNKVLTQNGDDFIAKELPKSIEIRDLWISKRGNGQIAEELRIKTDQGVFKVLTEYNIRYVLNCKKLSVTRQDGSVISSDTLLPSAFIWLESIQEGGKFMGYHIWGGGYGHGVGMSQNAAKAMAFNGMNYKEILESFFEGGQVYTVVEGS